MEHWRLYLGLVLHWEKLGDQCPLYQATSGETHFLNPLGAAILTYLKASHSHLDELCERLALDFEFADADNIRAQVASTLARFDELGLIRRQTGDDTAT